MAQVRAGRDGGPVGVHPGSAEGACSQREVEARREVEYQLSEAGDALEAVRASEVRLVATDLFMPGMDGLELLDVQGDDVESGGEVLDLRPGSHRKEEE